MNIDIINIGHYRVTSHGGRKFDLFNRSTDKVYSLERSEFEYIRKHGDVKTCEEVEEGQNL